MKTNYLSTALKNIDKEIAKLKAERDFNEQGIVALQVGIDILVKRIEGLEATKKSLGVERGAGDDYPVIEPQNWK